MFVKVNGTGFAVQDEKEHPSQSYNPYFYIDEVSYHAENSRIEIKYSVYEQGGKERELKVIVDVLDDNKESIGKNSIIAFLPSESRGDYTQVVEIAGEPEYIIIEAEDEDGFTRAYLDFDYRKARITGSAVYEKNLLIGQAFAVFALILAAVFITLKAYHVNKMMQGRSVHRERFIRV